MSNTRGRRVKMCSKLNFGGGDGGYAGSGPVGFNFHPFPHLSRLFLHRNRGLLKIA
jgi:hypothetical protein